MANRLLDLKSNFFCLIGRNDVFNTFHFQALVDLGLHLAFFVGLSRLVNAVLGMAVHRQSQVVDHP